MEDTPKERIGDYELIGLIGDGAQGRVYKARHVSEDGQAPGEIVALKVVRITGEDEKLRRKFQDQADILRRLSHTNIVAYRDCFAWHAGEWDEAQCLVMEMLEGETLHERLKKSSAGLPWPQVEQIFEQCLAGLIHARERGITHRDIKPSNIFLTNDGQAKLIDFDIARRDDSGQMSTAGWKGTFDYMSPDFITINEFRGDETSDVFSLGICFYQALTGTLPYEPLGETAHIGYLNRWRDNAAPAPSFRPGVFRVLANAKAVVSKAIAARRDQRYATFAALLEDFRKIRYRRIRHKNKEEYELLAVLGRGGFGEVFKARRVSDGLLVAVKFLFSEKQSERFLKEAKILQQYPHPNLVKYVDFITVEGTAGEKQFFLVMEFLEGMPGWTLRPRLKNEGKMEVEEAVTLFSGYLSALQFLHGSARPIIHRDIKPGNLYAPVGQPEKGKIFDLGVARDVSGTVTVGGVPGTLDYMAPEFAEAGGDRGSPQSDLYALGLCLYEALTGKPVFERLPTDLNSAWLAFQDRLRKPPAIAFDADAFVRYPRLKQVILTALAEKPAARFRSADEMRGALQSALLPPAVAQDHGDGFDPGEGVTMATFAGAHAEPEPGATVGTRALDPADVPAALAAMSERREVRRRPEGDRKKRLVIAGAAASAALLLFAGVYWMGRRGSPTPQRAPESEKPAAPKPAAVPVPAVPRKPDASPPAAPVQPPAPAESPKTVPAQEVTAPAAVPKKAETLPDVPAKPPVSKTSPAPAPTIADVLAAQPKVAPAQSAPRAVEPPPAPAAAPKPGPDPAALRAKELAEAAPRIDALHARLKQEGLSACGGAFEALSAVSPALLSDAGLKAKWDAVRDACVNLLDQAVFQKDPLDQRAQRLKSVGQAFSLPAAATVLGERAQPLRERLAQQQGVCVLRLVNQGEGPVQVSAREWPEKVPLAGGEVKEWLIPVLGETLTVSVSVDMGSRFRSRMETFKLPRSGGVERGIGGMGSMAVTPALKTAPAATPAAAPAPAPVPVPAPVQAAQQQAPAVPATPPAPASAPATLGKAFFEIAVAPKEASIDVDGKTVSAGRVEVSSDENHKVTATCQGYKPVGQYYRVKPGETRKIDLLLEKEIKRSLFGF